MSIIPQTIMDGAECRICFESLSTREDPLISPCLCNGTSKWVHKKCIQHWSKFSTWWAPACREI